MTEVCACLVTSISGYVYTIPVVHDPLFHPLVPPAVVPPAEVQPAVVHQFVHPAVVPPHVPDVPQGTGGVFGCVGSNFIFSQTPHTFTQSAFAKHF